MHIKYKTIDETNVVYMNLYFVTDDQLNLIEPSFLETDPHISKQNLKNSFVVLVV